MRAVRSLVALLTFAVVAARLVVTPGRDGIAIKQVRAFALVDVLTGVVEEVREVRCRSANRNEAFSTSAFEDDLILLEIEILRIMLSLVETLVPFVTLNNAPLTYVVLFQVQVLKQQNRLAFDRTGQVIILIGRILAPARALLEQRVLHMIQVIQVDRVRMQHEPHIIVGLKTEVFHVQIADRLESDHCHTVDAVLSEHDVERVQERLTNHAL